MESENEYNSSDEEELDEKYIFPQGKLLYPLSNKEEYIKNLQTKIIDIDTKSETSESSDEDEETDPEYLFNGIRLLYPIKDRVSYENYIIKHNSNPVLIKKKQKSILYNHNYMNEHEMEIVERWTQNKDCLEDWYDKGSIEKYLDMNEYIDYKKKI